jgi:hypothetical protein
MGWIRNSWRIELGLVKQIVVPIFANFRLSPKIGEETRIHSTWTWKAIALGRGNLTGDYKKIS